MKDSQDPVITQPRLADPPSHPVSPSMATARSVFRPSGITRRFNWEDGLWLVIVAILATLWVMLLMSPSWR